MKASPLTGTLRRALFLSARHFFRICVMALLPYVLFCIVVADLFYPLTTASRMFNAVLVGAFTGSFLLAAIMSATDSLDRTDDIEIQAAFRNAAAATVPVLLLGVITLILMGVVTFATMFVLVLIAGAEEGNWVRTLFGALPGIYLLARFFLAPAYPVARADGRWQLIKALKGSWRMTEGVTALSILWRLVASGVIAVAISVLFIGVLYVLVLDVTPELDFVLAAIDDSSLMITLVTYLLNFYLVSFQFALPILMYNRLTDATNSDMTSKVTLERLKRKLGRT